MSVEAGISIQTTRVILFALLAEITNRKDDPGGFLREFEALLKAGVDSAGFRAVPPLDADMVKHAALAEIEILLRNVAKACGLPEGPRHDKP